MPQHHHLPGWVRRAQAEVRPVLGDLLAALDGARRAQLVDRLDQLNTGISGGKFSLAWQYPEVVEEGAALFNEQRAESAAASRERRKLDDARARAGDRLRGIQDTLGTEQAGRLNASLRTARDLDTLAVIEKEIDRTGETARGVLDRRRQREIDRTRSRISKAAPLRGPAGEPAESWQEVLRRFAVESLAAADADA